MTEDEVDWADVKSVGVLASGVLSDTYKRHPVRRLLIVIDDPKWEAERKPIADALREAYDAGVEHGATWLTS